MNMCENWEYKLDNTIEIQMKNLGSNTNPQEYYDSKPSFLILQVQFFVFSVI